MIGASAAWITLSDQTSYAAALVGASPDHDLAVLKISTPLRSLTTVPIGTVEDLQVGQKVFAIGNPFGLDHTLTDGLAFERENSPGRGPDLEERLKRFGG